MTFKNVTELTGTAGTTNGELCHLLGYNNPADGGGGVFYWDSTSSLNPNLGTIFKVGNLPGRWIRNIDGDIVNVLWFGASGNPAIDSTAALQDAVRVANAYSATSPDPGSTYYGNKPTLYFPRGDRYTCKATLNIAAGVNVEMEAPVSFVDPTDSLPGMVIGSDSVANASVKLSLRIVKETISAWTNESCIGVKLINLLSSRLNLEFVSSFTINVQLLGSGQCAYNRVGIGTLKDGKIQLDLQASGTDGFCNENVFTGGRFSVNSVSTLADKARYGVRIGMSGTTAHIPNNNVFYKPSFELSESYITDPTVTECRAVLINRGINNRVWDARNENSGKCSMKITGADSVQNSVYIGYTDLSANEVNNAAVQIEDGSKSRNNRVANYPNYYNDAVNNSNCWQSLFLPLHINKYNSTNYFFRGLHCADKASSAVLPSRLVAAVTASYVEISGNTGIGVFINTSSAKKFIVRKNVDAGFGGRVSVVCYDSTGNILAPVIGANLFSPHLTIVNAGQFGGCYLNSSDVDFATSFTVGDNVAFIRVILTSGTANLRIRSFSVATLDFKQITAYTGLEAAGIDHNLSYAAVVPTEVKPKGTIIYNDWSITTGHLCWRNANGGTTWNEL
ncbi:hypothetical protein PV783_12945 [Chitinophaga sp. CC14]|uniref:hypothetical protein n=1 Tax=Chitinophaga sp. CC14 TaxID=3029199 RepID=UPI003B79772F